MRSLSAFTLLFLLCFIVRKGSWSFQLPKQPCKCSKVKESDKTDLEQNQGRHRRFKREDDRIVGGYVPQHNRPWAARVWNNKLNQLCGGTLINKRFVLTAAHCICFANKNLKCKDGKPQYDLKDVKIYLGVNKLEVDQVHRDLQGNDKFEYSIEDAVTHPGWDEGLVTNDVGLFKLDRDVKFKEGHLEPICLPLKLDESVDTATEGGPENEVYAAGWGNVFGSKCTTDEYGPQKNLKCQFPFSFHGNEHQSCFNGRTPSGKDDICKELKNFTKANYPKDLGTIASVFLPKENKNKTCYAYSTDFGWCKVVGTDDDFSANWGYCQKHCGDEESFKINVRPKKLQEARLNILPVKHCSDLIEQRKYNFYEEDEFCAGRKQKFKEIAHYERKGEKKFKFVGRTTNYFGLDKDGKYPYDYYVSTTDTCMGDSGGGVYQWKDGAPTLLGIVSRGMGSGEGEEKSGCAELNYPGIYVRVMKYLKWIHENSKTGNC